jgi:WD40 repeat protein
MHRTRVGWILSTVKRWCGRGAWRVVAAVLGGVLAASCSSADPEPRAGPTTPTVPLGGSVLAIEDFGRRVAIYDTRSRVFNSVEMGQQSGSVADAFWTGNGERILTLVRQFDGSTRLFEVGLDAEPRAVGPGGVGLGSFAHAGDVYMGTECIFDRAGGALARGVRVYTLDLSAPAEWRHIADGCAATLSPDGRSVAYTADARTMWVVPSDGSKGRRRLFDVADAEGLSPEDLDQAYIAGPPAWSDAGLAFSLAIGDRVAVGTLAPEGRLTAHSLGDNGVGLTAGLAWQPGGPLLAVTNASHAEGILRILDTETMRWRVVALANDPFMGLVWSPDGRAVVSSSRFSWTIVDPRPDGGRLHAVVAGRATPVDWLG